jgi:hypothetical protein
MQTSEAIDQVVSALAKARPLFPRLAKNKSVEVTSERGAYTFAYATLDEILHTVVGPLSTHGLALVCAIDAAPDGAVLVITRLCHTSGQWLQSQINVGRPTKLQALGSAITYAKRYTIAGLLAVQADEDDDANGADGNLIVAQTQTSPPQTPFPLDGGGAGEPTGNGDGPPPTTIPLEAGLPCGGQGIDRLKPAQLAMLVGKVGRLAEEKGGRWSTLLEALEAERTARLGRGRRPMAVVPPPNGKA